MLRYTALDVVNQVTPADISDPQELIARAAALSQELETPDEDYAVMLPTVELAA